MVSYIAALALEAWRPGFVTFFWNPQWLLIGAVVGAVVGSFGGAPKFRVGRAFAFFTILAILGAILVWQALPVSGTRPVATVAAFLVIWSSAFFVKS